MLFRKRFAPQVVVAGVGTGHKALRSDGRRSPNSLDLREDHLFTKQPLCQLSYASIRSKVSATLREGRRKEPANPYSK